MLFASWCVVLLVPPEQRDYGLSVVVNALAMVYYGLVLLITGYSRRTMQTLTAILGCGAILTAVFFVEIALLGPLLGEKFAGLVALVIIFWSVPVEGHIIARAIDRHWFVGIAIAIAAFVLQRALQLYATRA